MQQVLFSILIAGLIISTFTFAAKALIRVLIHKGGKRLINDIFNTPPYRCAGSSISNELSTHKLNIKTIIADNFGENIVKLAEVQSITIYYNPTFRRAQQHCLRCERFNVVKAVEILEFIDEYLSIEDIVKEHNEKFFNITLETNKEFFDTCLKYPLDQQQRRSIVSEEDNCLVVSSAGSGKTSSIIGKVKYLTQIKGVHPNRILLISYTNKAAAELTERLATPGLRGYTFHKLALDIIGKVTGKKPSICDNTDALFIECYRKLSQNEGFQKHIVKYFAEYQNMESPAEQEESKLRENLAEQKKKEIKAMLPDMDGRSIYVRSEQESKICFALSRLGVKFRYEEPYEHNLSDETHSQYRPDFSIHYTSGSASKRLYLEHFGVNEHGLVPSWFAKDKNMTYEEANKQYNDGITWKIEAHKKFDTQLIYTTSADFSKGDICDKLRALLSNAGVPLCEKSYEELYTLVMPQGSKREKSFIRLVATFVTLLKTSCKSPQEVLQQMKFVDDERSLFITKHIFMPVYELYQALLEQRGQIDFTDAIIRATELCNTMETPGYEHIIVDEFQDISVDRYNFLKALRKGDPQARLYCVGDDWQSIYRFSGSDMSLFNQFSDYFGPTEISKIETTYRFGEPLVSMSARFIQTNTAQISKQIRPFNQNTHTDLSFVPYEKQTYCTKIEQILCYLPEDKSVFLLGRYSFDDIHLSASYQSAKENEKFYYIIGGRKVEFLTVHKSKGLEADYVILLQCNRDTYGFPSLVSDDPVLNYVLTQGDRFPFGEERRLFYVAITRAKVKTFVMYDSKTPSVFVDEFIQPEKVTQNSYAKHRNAQKIWTKGEDKLLMTLFNEGKSVKEISVKMGRSQTAIIMRLGKLNS